MLGFLLLCYTQVFIFSYQMGVLMYTCMKTSNVAVFLVQKYKLSMLCGIQK